MTSMESKMETCPSTDERVDIKRVSKPHFWNMLSTDSCLDAIFHQEHICWKIPVDLQWQRIIWNHQNNDLREFYHCRNDWLYVPYKRIITLEGSALLVNFWSLTFVFPRGTFSFILNVFHYLLIKLAELIAKSIAHRTWDQEIAI